MEKQNDTYLKPVLQTPKPALKQAYKKPVLAHYGKLSSLTQGGVSPSAGEYLTSYYQASG